MGRKKIVLFVEGKGDPDAVRALVDKLLSERNAWEYLAIDKNVFRVGGLHNLTGSRADNWTAKLLAARKRRDIGAILLVLDGDQKHVLRERGPGREPFCAAVVARRLANKAREAGGGSVFSVACVFAMREFESWLIAGVESIRGKRLPDGRLGVREDAEPPEHDTDDHPRDAKGWLSKNMANGYKPSTDQAGLAHMVGLESIRQKTPRSFQRLEHAVEELCSAIRCEQHLVSPSD